MKRTRNRMLPSIMLALLAGAGLGACAMEEAPGVPADAVRLASQVLEQRAEAYSAFAEPARLVIRDAGAWEQLWSQDTETAGAAPAVDFERDMVLVASMGERRSGGYSIVVEGVFENADGIYVQVLETSPSRRCTTTQALTRPVTMVTVPRREGSVFWVERSRTRC